MEINQILDERQKTHGNFKMHAQTAQYLKATMRATEKWNELEWEQKEALEMIAHKIARILCGNADFQDHWTDISGYATLVGRELSEG